MFIKFYQMLKPSVNNLNYLLILCFMCLCFVLTLGAMEIDEFF